MQGKNYDSGGALFPNDRKQNERSPDFRGNLRINREMLDHLIECMENGQEMTLTLFGYNRQGNKGRFLGLNPAIPLNNNQDSRPPRQVDRGYQQQGRSYQRPQQNSYPDRFNQGGQRNSYAEQSRGGPQRTSWAPRKQQVDAMSMDEFRKGDGFPENLGGNADDDPLPWES